MSSTNQFIKVFKSMVNSLEQTVKVNPEMSREKFLLEARNLIAHVRFAKAIKMIDEDSAIYCEYSVDSLVRRFDEIRNERDFQGLLAYARNLQEDHVNFQKSYDSYMNLLTQVSRFPSDGRCIKGFKPEMIRESLIARLGYLLNDAYNSGVVAESEYKALYTNWLQLCGGGETRDKL